MPAMEWQWTPYSVPVIIAVILSAALAVQAWRRRPSAGAASVALLMVALAWWSFGYALELSSATFEWELFWTYVQYVGIVLSPAAWLLFAVDYSGRKRALTRRRLVMLAIEPVLALALVFTNDVHHLVWRSVESVDTAGFSALSRTYGVAFWIHTAYSYALLGIGAALLLGYLLRSPRLFRGQFIAALVAVAVPWVGSVLYVTGLNPFDGLDVSPLAFTLSGVCVVFGLYRYRLLDLVPVARDALIEELSDGVIVLDAQNRVVDINPAAQHLLGRPFSDVVGKPMEAAFAPALGPDHPPVATAPDRTEVAFTVGSDRRYVELRVRPLEGPRTPQGGSLLILRDVTEQRMMVERLCEANDQLVAAQRSLEVQANTDPLTGAMNRRAILELLDQELSRAQRDATPLSIAILDIDDFKLINDSHGHYVGDEILRQLACRLRLFMRPYDSLGRVGGEEFLIVAPGVDELTTHDLLDRIRLEVSSRSFPVEKQELWVTVSLGGATYHTESAEMLYRLADDALYRAKAAGRNCCVTAGATEQGALVGQKRG
jgi:diguanylate cyclase (GGDEF)-like protein/PAS domain S-box-containing protein